MVVSNLWRKVRLKKGRNGTGGRTPSARPVVLFGMMGSGKSTLGLRLAQCFGVRFVDSDREVEKQTGRTITQMFAEKGEAHFRRLEKEVVADCLGRTGFDRDSDRGVSSDSESPPVSMVLALGGGAILHSEIQILVQKQACAVWLDAPPAILLRRLKKERDTRPVLGTGTPLAERIESLMKTRTPVYKDMADIHFKIESDEAIEKTVRRLAQKVQDWHAADAAPGER